MLVCAVAKAQDEGPHLQLKTPLDCKCICWGERVFSIYVRRVKISKNRIFRAGAVSGVLPGTEKEQPAAESSIVCAVSRIKGLLWNFSRGQMLLYMNITVC